MRGHADTLAVFLITAGFTAISAMELNFRLGVWFVPAIFLCLVPSFFLSVWIVVGVINLLNLIISFINRWSSG